MKKQSSNRPFPRTEMEFTIFYAFDSAYEGPNCQYPCSERNSLRGVERDMRVGRCEKPGENG